MPNQSDEDISVFFDPLGDRCTEHDRLADLRVRVLDEPGAFIDAKPYPAGTCRYALPLMNEIRCQALEP